MKHIFGAKSKLLVSLLALICIMAVGGTMAYLFANTGLLTNTFSSAELDTGIKDTGTGTNKTVEITNKGKSPAWVRVRLLVSGIDPAKVEIAADQSVANERVQADSDKICLVLNDKSHWQTTVDFTSYEILMDGDGWIYYTEPLASYATTDALLKGVAFGNSVNAEDISITVTHESVLALDTSSVGGKPAYVAAFENPAGASTPSPAPTT